VIAPTFAAAPDARLLELWAAGREQRRVRRTELLLEAAGLEPATDPSLGEVDRRLLALRERCFGPRVDLVVDCPACGQRLQVGLDVGDLRTERPVADLPNVISADGDVRVLFRLPTLADLRAVEAAGSMEAARRTLVQRCVIDARHGGARVDALSLSNEVVARIGQAMAAADRQADVRLGLRCPDCAHEWDPSFDIAAFLWMEIDARVRRLLVDVHTLARAYGWSESEILGLPPVRRQVYLELALG